MKDQIIEKCGNKDLRKEAFENELSLKQLVHTGKTLEAVTESSKLKPKQNIECNRCGLLGHAFYDRFCPAKESRCEICHYIGHFTTMCFFLKGRVISKGSENERPLPPSFKAQCEQSQPANVKRQKLDVVKADGKLKPADIKKL